MPYLICEHGIVFRGDNRCLICDPITDNLCEHGINYSDNCDECNDIAKKEEEENKRAEALDILRDRLWKFFCEKGWDKQSPGLLIGLFDDIVEKVYDGEVEYDGFDANKEEIF